jgi:hypothetical protein
MQSAIDPIIQADAEGNNPLHLCASRGTPEELQTLLRDLGQRQLLITVLFRYNRDGFTPLHLAVLNNTAEMLNALITALGPYASSAAVTRETGAPRRLPIHMLCEKDKEGDRYSRLPLQLSPDAQKKVNLLWDMTFQTPPDLVEMDAPIDKAVFLKRGERYVKSESLIHKCCEVMTEVRKAIPHSATHRSCNKLSHQQAVKLMLDLRKMRKKADEKSAKPFQNWEALARRIKVYEEAKMGNCQERAEYTLYLLYKNFGIPGKIVHFLGGDHVFNIIHENSNPSNTASPPSLIVDTWSGDMFFEDEKWERLKNCYSILKYHPEIKKYRRYCTVGSLLPDQKIGTLCSTEALNPPAFVANISPPVSAFAKILSSLADTANVATKDRDRVDQARSRSRRSRSRSPGQQQAASSRSYRNGDRFFYNPDGSDAPPSKSTPALLKRPDETHPRRAHRSRSRSRERSDRGLSVR